MTMPDSWAAIHLTEVPIWLEKELTHGEFPLKVALLVIALTVIVVSGGVAVIWLSGRAERLRERFFPLHSCDQHALDSISEVFEGLSRESRRYDFIAHRIRIGTWHGKEWMFVWGTLGATTPGEGGPEWGSGQCIFVREPRSEEENLRRHGEAFPFLFCGKDRCILRLPESKIREVTFLSPMSA